MQIKELVSSAVLDSILENILLWCWFLCIDYMTKNPRKCKLYSFRLRIFLHSFL